MSPRVLDDRPHPSARRRPRARAAALAALALLLAAGAAAAQEPQPAAEAVHPFYADLLEQGIFAYQQGSHAEAETDLRLAVFGLLESPRTLARGLAYLALAQAAGGGGEALEATLQRVLALERRAPVFGQAELSPAARGAFEELLVSRLPESTLAQIPAFRRLADAKLAARLAGLRPAERRRALEEKVASVPDDPAWLLALAELELAERNFPAAAARAAQILALADRADPGQTTAARCVRGRALASTGGCAAAVADLDACPAARTDVDAAAALLECRVTLGQWLEAQALLDSLPPSVAAARPVSRHRRQVSRQVARLPHAPPAAAAADAESGPPARTPGPAPATGGAARQPENGASPAQPEPSPAALPADARAELARARGLLASANLASELEDPLRIAREVADAHPDSAEAQHLAAEIAYRASRWEEAARYFRRGGEPAQPEMLFYMAVSLFEAGEQEAAKPLLERALPSLPRTPFVEGYAERILGPGAG